MHAVDADQQHVLDLILIAAVIALAVSALSLAMAIGEHARSRRHRQYAYSGDDAHEPSSGYRSFLLHVRNSSAAVRMRLDPEDLADAIARTDDCIVKQN